MATKELKNQMDGFMQPASDQAPTMGLYDTNTPQSVREGTPLRLFDKNGRGGRYIVAMRYDNN